MTTFEYYVQIMTHKTFRERFGIRSQDEKDGYYLTILDSRNRKSIVPQRSKWRKIFVDEVYKYWTAPAEDIDVT